MRSFLPAAIIAVLALMCGGGIASGREAIRADVGVVRSLYEAFAWEAVLEDWGQEQTLVVQPRPVLLRYFTPKLSELILQDRECVARMQEICNLDFLPLWDSQDPTGATVTIAGGSDPGEVLVKVRYSPNEERKLVFRLANGSDGWRIEDIVFEGWAGLGGDEKGRMSLSRLLARHIGSNSAGK